MVRRRVRVVTLAVALVGCRRSSPATAEAKDAAPPPTFCQKQTPAPKVCEDFDAPDFDVATRIVQSDGDAKLVLGERGKRALALSSVPVDVASGADEGAWMMTNAMLDHDLTEAHAAFDVEVVSIAAGGSAPLRLVQLALGSWTVTLEISGDALQASEAYMDRPAPRNGGAAGKLPRNAWARVAIDVLAGKSLTVSIDGKVAYEARPPLRLDSAVRQVDMVLGVRQPAPPTANEVRFDDVVLDAK